MLKTVLRLLFERNRDTLLIGGVLNLASMAACPDLAEVTSSIDFNTRGFCDGLVEVIRETLGPVDFINIDSNNVRTLVFFLDALFKQELSANLKGLSCANNGLNNFDFVGKLKPNQFPSLLELRFANCPIAKRGDYRQVISKALPNLSGLDGDALTRPPLGLQWPLNAEFSEEQRNFLLQSEKLINTLATEGSDAALFMYHPSCLLTFSALNFNVNTRAKSKDAQVALQRLRNHMSDRSRNCLEMLKRGTGSVCFRGRSDVAAHLTQVMYPKGFHVMQELDRNANVTLIAAGAGVLMPLAIVTLHGKIMWAHQTTVEGVDRPPRACFDRVLTFTPDAQSGGGWLIANDAIRLRPFDDDPVFTCVSQSRIARMALKLDFDAGVLTEVFGVGRSDADIVSIVGDLKNVGAQVLGRCDQLAGGNHKMAVLACVVVSRCGRTPEEAVAALQQANGDIGTVLTRLAPTSA